MTAREFNPDLDEVLVVPPDVDLDQLKAFIDGGPVPDRAHVVPFDEWTAQGRPSDCDCGHIACVCAVARAHGRECRYRKAVTCAVGIECECGFDVCPKCDPCTCSSKENETHDTV